MITAAVGVEESEASGMSCMGEILYYNSWQERENEEYIGDLDIIIGI